MLCYDKENTQMATGVYCKKCTENLVMMSSNKLVTQKKASPIHRFAQQQWLLWVLSIYNMILTIRGLNGLEIPAYC
jgi:hypothetical protein